MAKRKNASIESVEHDEPTWDVFISYASEDREPFVIALVRALRSVGLSVWYDEFQVKIGHSLREAIDAGIRGCRFGVVVLSRNFFGKLWTNRELDGLLGQERSDRKTLLPIWLQVQEKEVRRFSPVVASRHALKASIGAKKIADEVKKQVQPRIHLRIDRFDGHTTVWIVPEWGVIMIENTPPDGESSGLAPYDFAGRRIDFEEEFPRFQETKPRAQIHKFDGLIALVQINSAVCDQKTVEDRLGIVLNPNPRRPEQSIPFLPVFVCPAFTLGLMNEEIVKAAIGAGVRLQV